MEMEPKQAAYIGEPMFRQTINDYFVVPIQNMAEVSILEGARKGLGLAGEKKAEWYSR